MDCYFVGTKMGVSNRVLSVVALVVCAVCGAILWRAHVSAVNDAVDAERDRLMLDFEREKGAAVKRESDRAKGIIEAVKGGYENELKTIQARADRLLADRNAGVVRLSVPAHCPTVRGDASGVKSDSGAVAPETRAELSAASVEFFIGEARRADETVNRLNELVDIVEPLRLGSGGVQ